MTELDDQVVAEFRANAGVVLDAMGGHFSNIHLLLLHNTGRRSGRVCVTPLALRRRRRQVRPHRLQRRS
jgi:F420H(2)-dependent quinone reductase